MNVKTDGATIGAQMRQAREARNWSQTDLAERLGMSQRWVSGLETGEIGTPRLDTLRRACDLFGWDLADAVVWSGLAKTRRGAERVIEASGVGGPGPDPIAELCRDLEELARRRPRPEAFMADVVRVARAMAESEARFPGVNDEGGRSSPQGR